MQRLCKNEIPEYLKDSEFYNNIESDEPFEIPIEYYKKEIIIKTFDDLVSYIRILNYWLVNKIPNEIYKWVSDNKNKVNIVLLNENFPNHQLINEIKIIVKPTDIEYNKCCTWALIFLIIEIVLLIIVIIFT